MAAGARIGVAAAVLLATGGMAAEARNIRIALGLPETWAAHAPLVRFAERLQSEAALNARVYSMSLLSLAETPGGVRDGLADIGLIAFPYFPVEYSEVNLVANLSMLATIGEVSGMPGAAIAGASMEYTLLNCPSCVRQMAEQNQVYITGGSTPPQVLFCTRPITTPEEIQGRRFRTGAANYSRWVEHFGGTSVAVSGNEIYTAMGQGTVDCSISSAGDLVGARYIDVTRAVTIGAPGGAFSGLGVANMNLGVWRELTTEQRAVVLNAGAWLAAETVAQFQRDDVTSLEAARAQNLPVLEASQELRDATAAFVEADILVIQEQFTSNYGVTDVAEKITLFRELVARWIELTRELGPDDAEALGQLYWDEILSQVDPATYALD